MLAPPQIERRSRGEWRLERATSRSRSRPGATHRPNRVWDATRKPKDSLTRHCRCPVDSGFSGFRGSLGEASGDLPGEIISLGKRRVRDPYPWPSLRAAIARSSLSLRIPRSTGQHRERPPNIALQPTSPASPSPRLSAKTLGARSCSQPGSTNRSLSVYLAIGCVLALMCTKPASVEAQALLGTAEGSNQAVVFPSPNVGLPFPIQLPITGITGSNQPHGVSFFGQDDALVAGGTGIYVVRVSTREVVSIIPTAPYYDGSGSLAVSPNRSLALASGGSNQVTVIAAPFGPGSQISTVALPGGVPQQTTRSDRLCAQRKGFHLQRGRSLGTGPDVHGG